MPKRKPCSFDGCKNTGTGPWCSTHYRQLAKTGTMRPVATHLPRPTECAADGCDNKRKEPSKLCSKHAARQWRHGDLNANHRRVARERFVASHGYVVVRAVGHPLADRDGDVYEHRKVLFDQIGPGVHACAWCGKRLAWSPVEGAERLEVDHFNADREDNHPANLLPCCRHCNSSRALSYRIFRDGTSRKCTA